MDVEAESTIADAVARLGPGPLTEEGVQEHLRPLFTRSLKPGQVYLLSHALGRPPDRTHADVAEGLAAWSDRLRGAWEPWLVEEMRYRESIARLLGLGSHMQVVPKVHAEAALRAVLNTLPPGAAVVTTDDEFTAVAVVLAQYAALGRLRVVRAASEGGRWTAQCVIAALEKTPEAALAVVSHCFFKDGHLFQSLPELAEACRACGAQLLVDAYHSVGAVPVNMPSLSCDYLLGGCYKYLRGGPGIAFLALGPEAAANARTLDVGYFGLEPGPFGSHDLWRTGGPPLQAGGDGWLEGSPAVLTYYQARAGLGFTLAVGMDRLRAYSLGQLGFLRTCLEAWGIASGGGDAEHGAFLTIPAARAPELVAGLAEEGIICDERAGRLRLCPEVLTTRAELERTAQELLRFFSSCCVRKSDNR